MKVHFISLYRMYLEGILSDRHVRRFTEPKMNPSQRSSSSWRKNGGVVKMRTQAEVKTTKKRRRDRLRCQQVRATVFHRLWFYGIVCRWITIIVCRWMPTVGHYMNSIRHIFQQQNISAICHLAHLQCFINKCEFYVINGGKFRSRVYIKTVQHSLFSQATCRKKTTLTFL